ncbi:MAG: two-component sensor histidine kinase, partial [Planctomycetes bacterium]|nr:two-component sensor histidine kinase [Planctomycetota bacterium]
GMKARDSGHGIRVEDQKKLFQPYFTTKAQGTGLGLFVCKNILEDSSSGTIEIDDAVKDGAKFIVSLNCEELNGLADIPPGPANELKFVTT